MDEKNQSEPLPFEEAKDLWDNFANSGDDEIEPLTEEQAKEFRLKLYARIEAYEAKKRNRKIIRYSSAMAAAVLLLLASILTYRNYISPDVYYAKENDKIFVLKDGSQITLSKGAKLTVEKSFPSDTRDVFLEGNAIFKVSKSKTIPFIVHTASYQTKVLGTVFKISQSKSTFNVDLFEGKVQINKNEKPLETFVIHPRETFSNLGSNKVASIKPTDSGVANPKVNTATLSFNDVYLADVIHILESTYSIKINYPTTISDLKISAIKENATASELLQSIAIQLNLNTKKINDKTFELEE